MAPVSGPLKDDMSGRGTLIASETGLPGGTRGVVADALEEELVAGVTATDVRAFEGVILL